MPDEGVYACNWKVLSLSIAAVLELIQFWTIFLMPFVSLIEELALTLTQLTLITLIVVLADITLHLRLQLLQHIISEILLETHC